MFTLETVARYSTFNPNLPNHCNSFQIKQLLSIVKSCHISVLSQAVPTNMQNTDFLQTNRGKGSGKLRLKEKMVPRKERFGSPQNMTECAASTSLKMCNVRLETCLSA